MLWCHRSIGVGGPLRDRENWVGHREEVSDSCSLESDSGGRHSLLERRVSTCGVQEHESKE